MGVFNRKPKMPKGPVTSWEGYDVKQWVKFIGFAKYKHQFATVEGKDLINMSTSSLINFVGDAADAKQLFSAITQLRATQGLPPVVEDKPQTPVREAPVPAPEEPVVAPVHPAAAENAAEGAEGVSKPATPEVQVEGDNAENSNPNADKGDEPAPSPLKWVKNMFGTKGEEEETDTQAEPEEPAASDVVSPTYSQNMEMMSKWAGGASRLQELTAYFDQLNIMGHGLVKAAEAAPIVGMIVGALWDLHDAAVVAKGNRPNVVQLDNFCQDVLRVFEYKGKQAARMQPQRLQNLFDLICEAVRIVQNCGRPGWLLRMACDERSVEDFTMVHNTILETLRSENMDSLSNQRRLDYGSYLDASKPLRRKLKQLGSGTVEAGLRAVKRNEPALEEIIKLVQVDANDVLKELESVDSELDDLATIYTKTTDGNVVEEQLYIRECEDIFDTYARQHPSSLEFDELRMVVADMGYLSGVNASEADNFVMSKFNLHGVDTRITFDHFAQFYKQIKLSRARHELRTTLGVQLEFELRQVFTSFASFGTRQLMQDMDGARWTKLCKDCKLLGKGCNSSDVDLLFLKAKAKGARRISFEQFVQALSMLADKRGKTLDEVVNQILNAGGPINSGTQAQYCKFHDDKSTYTGVYSRGGPNTIEPNRDLSYFLDRSDCDVRGVKKAEGTHTPMRSSAAFPNSHAIASPSFGTPMVASTPRSRRPAESRAVSSPVPMSARTAGFSTLHEAYKTFASFGMGHNSTPNKALELDSLRFAKMMRDCDLLDSKFTSTDVDMIFVKSKAKGARKINYKEFQYALEVVADSKGMSVQEVHDCIIRSRGPVAMGTKPDAAIRFYEDALSTPRRSNLRGSVC